MKPCILFRVDRDTQEESKIAEKYFPIHRDQVGMKDRLVVGRYSVLPYYQEVQRNMELQGSKLINSYEQHQYIANFDYYEDLKDYTFQTWFRLEDVPKDGGPFVVKGKTNSRKFHWDTQMFAKTYRDAAEIYCDLMNDALIGPQGVIVRRYEPLEVLEYGVNGMPMSNEWRFFFLGDTLLSHGFYWTISEKRGEMDEMGMLFAQRIAKIASLKTNFFVVDIARTDLGKWILVELNDGQMSGLSGNDPEKLYSELLRALDPLGRNQIYF